MAVLDAVVIAGGIPEPGDPLYEQTQGQPKALLDVCGKPMAQWVLDALSQAESVGQVVLLGLPEDSGLQSPKLKAFLPGQGGMVDNIRVGALKVKELNPSATHALIVSSDVPGVTAEMLNWMVGAVTQTDDDLYYNVVERPVMEKRYPGSKRSYLRLKDVDVCGGDVNACRISIVTENTEFWEKLVATRKNALKQAALIGYDTLLLVLLRVITLEGAVRKVAQRVNLKGKAILCPYAEIAMDVDKPHQLELMRTDLHQRLQR